jgi:hypothetical protein
MAFTLAEPWRAMSPQLTADVTLYPTAQGGRKYVAQLGWGCLCLVSKLEPLIGWDAWALLEEPLAPA